MSKADVIEVEAAVFRVGKLGDDFAVQHDRTGDELGEERDKQRVIQNVIARHGAPIAVDDIGKLLEGEERNAQRERDAVERQVQTEGMVHVIKEEIVIFEIEQHAEIDCQTQQHQQKDGGGSVEAVGQILQHGILLPHGRFLYYRRIVPAVQESYRQVSGHRTGRAAHRVCRRGSVSL